MNFLFILMKWTSLGRLILMDINTKFVYEILQEYPSMIYPKMSGFHNQWVTWRMVWMASICQSSNLKVCSHNSVEVIDVLNVSTYKDCIHIHWFWILFWIRVIRRPDSVFCLVIEKTNSRPFPWVLVFETKIELTLKIESGSFLPEWSISLKKTS